MSEVLLHPGYTGEIKFASPSSGVHGAHGYVITIMSAGDAGTTGEILRDGVPFPADWTYADSAVQEASPWANEIYDGLMATFAPSMPAANGCVQAQFSDYNSGVPIPQSDCLFYPDDGAGNSYLGVRPLGLFLRFTAGTNQVNEIYSFWLGGNAASCQTPQAAIEQMTESIIQPGYFVPAPYAYGFWIAGAIPMQGSNPNGLGISDFQTLYGCGGSSWTPPDNGYGGMQWGATGQVAVEYNLDSGINYKVYAQNGYLGTLQFTDEDGGIYTFGIGSAATLGSNPVSIDWTSAATANPAVTSISNAYFNYLCGPITDDTDCVAAGDCTIVPDDGSGHSAFSLAPSANMIANYCYLPEQPVTIVFPKGSSTPEQIYVTNPGGM